MNDFVVERWDLDPFPGDQAPAHVHHDSDSLIRALHKATTDEERTDAWNRHASALAPE
jgi:hypothetical protein